MWLRVGYQATRKTWVLFSLKSDDRKTAYDQTYRLKETRIDTYSVHPQEKRASRRGWGGLWWYPPRHLSQPLWSQLCLRIHRWDWSWSLWQCDWGRWRLPQGQGALSGKRTNLRVIACMLNVQNFQGVCVCSYAGIHRVGKTDTSYIWRAFSQNHIHKYFKFIKKVKSTLRPSFLAHLFLIPSSSWFHLPTVCALLNTGLRYAYGIYLLW